VGALFAAEWVKLRHRWMPRIIALIMFAIVALFFWGLGTTSNRTDLIFPRGLLAALLSSAFVATFLWPILSGAWAGNEYSWGTLRMILSRRPNRIQYLAASLGILVVFAIITMVLAMVFSIVEGGVVAVLTGHSVVFTTGLRSNFTLVLLKTFVATIYVVCFYLVLAFAAGTIFQSPAAGIGIGIGFSIAQQVVFGIFYALRGPWRVIADHFPSAYAGSLPQRVALEGTSIFGSAPANSPGIVESVMGLAIYIGILVALTVIVVQRRDVTA
jgi:hypothetical protein